MEAGARLVYLSPHLDDVALSCGGLVYQQAQCGVKPLVITCYAGVPDYYSLSPFAMEQHQRWGRLIGLVERRRCEDAAAMAYLGAEYQHWDYLDCIYRRRLDSSGFLYVNEEALFGAVQNEDRLVNELAERLATLLSRDMDVASIYAPLAVGHHVDHQIVFQAAIQLRHCGFRVQFYEDYPYAEDTELLDRALHQWARPPLPTVQILSDEALEAKIAAVHFYRSQLDVLFGGEQFVAERVKIYAMSVKAGGGYGERYWEGGTW